MSGPRESGRLQKGRPRTGARLAAVQALFQSEQAGENPETVIQQFVRHRLGPNDADEGLGEGRVPDADAKLFARIVRDTAARIESLDETIGKALAKDWPLEKLDPVLRALLRAAAGELSTPHEPPARVVINEYLDIAHGFFVGDEPRFANGVLDALARSLRADEFVRP
ncbi:transcription antitermination factor NusB [Falsiroseomonas stagni]|uniref:Transcription antitermination protein NusB n=1 Tax=Falsiroseomonas stagni DSM 19981 TaxID=1123062 RepID=A0A1I4ARG6_9PROT|nr:transcription antitermination factor NusB [Falsiroseomonas stagni]SFK59122.1 NusB antitermination factor [Falsiroseomonas stagni DSM 19981]